MPMEQQERLALVLVGDRLFNRPEQGRLLRVEAGRRRQDAWLLHWHFRPAPERPPIVRGAAPHKARDPGTRRLLYRVVCPDLDMYAFPDSLCDVFLVLTKDPVAR